MEETERPVRMAENELHVELGQAVRHQQDGGAYPSICINNDNTVVKMNNSAGLRSRLYCNVGKIESGGGISWGESSRFDHGGRYPRVAINNDDTVVEVHQSQYSRELHFRVGVVDTARKSIQWGNSRCYDSGMNPAVALLDGGSVISVYQTSALGSYATVYRVGSVDVEHKNILWGNPSSYGRGKKLALAANQAGAVVEVHKGVLGNNLYYRVGKLDKGIRTILWGEDTLYGKGHDPCVAIDSEGHVLEVHSSTVLRRLHRRVAVVHTRRQTLDWVQDDLQYDMGVFPSICLNDNADTNVVETHVTNFGETIWCRTGTLKPSKADNMKL